ncbi:hypothetical protein EBU94_00380 [bacterium]|nr:hypothetical protein [bacterium]
MANFLGSGPIGPTAENEPQSANVNPFGNLESPPAAPEYYAVLLGVVPPLYIYGILLPPGDSVDILGESIPVKYSQIITVTTTPEQFRQQGRNIWPGPGPTPDEDSPFQSTNTQTANNSSAILDDENPLDPRLVFLAETEDNKSASFIMSFTSNQDLTAPLVEGFIYPDTGVSTQGQNSAGGTQPVVVQDPKTPRDKIYNPQNDEFRGVPALISDMAYIFFAASGGKAGIKNLIDRENEPRWYDVTNTLKKQQPDGTPISSTQELTVKDIIAWSNQPGNRKFPYKYQDFVFCKWWQKIPLNYMITLRRYTRPVNDRVESEFDHEFKNGNDELKLRSAVHAVTFLGEDSGNKISSILGPIEAGLKWKPVKAEVWEVTPNGDPDSAESPFPGLARALGYATKGWQGYKDEPAPQAPPDPYSNGPYANKIYGGMVTVIDSTQARDRGITFKHSISLVFEYRARSIGGINTKAAMLDIISNFMILTFNSAVFWGGENRFMPGALGGAKAPFLGGEAGRKAWINGQPDAFFSAVSDQFIKGLGNVADVFNKLFEDPVSTLKSVASGAATGFMKLKSTQGRIQVQGIHSLLTGAPVGEWHITVGNPMNPMMMIGNLICTGVKLEFNDELGPDDFPTELKATVTLEHGMPRDKTAIESMFNKGGGRLYSLPPGLSFSSESETPVDTSWNKDQSKGTGGKGSKSYSNNPLLGDPAVIDNIFSEARNSTVPNVTSISLGVINHGYATISGGKSTPPARKTQ